MEDLITNVVTYLTDFLNALGPIAGFFLIVLESMIPVLPLAVFVALNVNAFGLAFGFILSWIATIIGCMIMYFLCKKLHRKFLKKYEKNEQIKNFKEKINKLSLPSLVLIIAIPFTPAFAVNIAAGLSNISTKKYFLSLIIGKIFTIYFWGFIGKTFIESFTDYTVLLKIIIMLLVAFIISKIVNRIFKL